MLRWYQSKLAKQPILTAGVMSAVLFGCGDVLAQQVVDRKGFAKHDVARTGRMALYGGAIFGPAATTWFGFLQRHVVFKNRFNTLAARVLADQGLFTPLHLNAFLSSMAIMEGSDPIERLRSTFLPSYKANLMIWPLVQGVNFSIIPLDYRVLFVNVISLGMYYNITEYYSDKNSHLEKGWRAIANLDRTGWNCILSLLNSGEE